MKIQMIAQPKSKTKPTLILTLLPRLLSISLLPTMLLKIALLPITLALTLSFCTEKPPTPCRDILSAIMTAEIGLPAGKIYDMRAAEGEREFLPERLLSTLYGDGKTPPMREGWLDIALFLPLSDHPCEFAVILCDSDDTARDTARLLLCRLDLIRTTKGNSTTSPSHSNAKTDTPTAATTTTTAAAPPHSPLAAPDTTATTAAAPPHSPLAAFTSPATARLITLNSERATTPTATLAPDTFTIAALTSPVLAPASGGYSSLLESATVTIVGNYVILIVSSDPQTALKEARQQIN